MGVRLVTPKANFVKHLRGRAGSFGNQLDWKNGERNWLLACLRVATNRARRSLGCVACSFDHVNAPVLLSRFGNGNGFVSHNVVQNWIHPDTSSSQRMKRANTLFASCR